MEHFPCPSQRLIFSRLNKDSMEENKCFDGFPQHSIHLFIPSSNFYKEKYENILMSDENIYFIVKNVTAASLIEASFLEHFIHKGSLWATTHNANAEFDNFLSIIPPGKLILSLEKGIAECLSFTKERDNGRKKKKRKYFQTSIIDISYSHFSCEAKTYKSVLFELEKINSIPFTLVLKWQPNGDICSHSIKDYFERQGFECSPCQPNHRHSTEFSVPVPKISPDVFDTDVYENILEWIGAHICGINYADADEYVSKFTVPESSEIFDKLYIGSWEGFYTGDQVNSLIKELGNIFVKDSSVPFIALAVSGYKDCYLKGKGFEHFSSADKLISVIIFPNHEYWFISLNGP